MNAAGVESTEGHALVRVVDILRTLHATTNEPGLPLCGYCTALTGAWIGQPCSTIVMLDAALSNLPKTLQERLGVAQ